MTDKRKDVFVSGLVICLAVLVLAAVGIFIAVSGNFGDIPKAVSALFGDDDDKVEIIPGDDGKIYESLKGIAEYDNIQVEKGLSADNAIEILKNLKVNESYHCTYEISRYFEDASMTSFTEVWKQGDSYRVMDIEDGSEGELIIHSGDETYFRDANGSRTVKGGEFTLASDAGFADIGAIAEALAREGVVSSSSIVRSTDGGENILYIEYTDSVLGVSESVYILIEAGVIVNSSYSYGGNIVYEQKVLVVEYGQTIPESYFEIVE